jgi:DNA-binding CsgD family transcriptional regulator
MSGACDFSDLSSTTSRQSEESLPIGRSGSSVDKSGGSSSRASDLLAAGLEALDFLNLGVLVTDESRTVYLANRTAGRILKERDGIELSIEGALTDTRGACNPSLGSVIRQVGGPHEPNSSAIPSCVLAVRRRSGRRPLTLLVRSVDESPSTTKKDKRVLVFLLDPERPTRTTEDGLRNVFELTTSEAKLATFLMSGQRLEDCCDHLDIRASTARMHLGNIFAKTRVQRQGQLVALLLKSVGMIGGSQEADSEKMLSQPMTPGMPRQGGISAQFDVTSTLAAGLEALNLVNVGVVVINHSRRIIFKNHTVQQILEARDGLAIADDSTLVGTTKSCRAQLSSALDRATSNGSNGSAHSKSTTVAVKRPSGKRSLTLLVRALDTSSTQVNANYPALVLFLLDPELPITPDDDGLRQLYGFTSTEARLAHLLMEGNTVQECCAQLAIRPSTARMHLGNLFAKTGVQGQGQLISLLLKSVGILRVKRHSAAIAKLPS